MISITTIVTASDDCVLLLAQPQDDAFLPSIYTSVLNAAQTVVPCESMALGNAIFTYDGDYVCVYMSFSGLQGMEISSFVGGPALVGEAGVPLADLSLGSNKRDCFMVDEETLLYMDLGLLLLQ